MGRSVDTLDLDPEGAGWFTVLVGSIIGAIGGAFKLGQRGRNMEPRRVTTIDDLIEAIREEADATRAVLRDEHDATREAFRHLAEHFDAKHEKIDRSLMLLLERTLPAPRLP